MPSHVKEKIVGAYDRDQLIELRRPIMEQWSKFLSGEDQTAEVIPLAAKRA